MKKKLLFLVPLISTSMVLTACGGLGGGGEGGNGISLPNTAEQAVNMFYQFASNTGVEITYRVYDDESAQPETNTIGFKNDVFWVKESVAYKKVGTTLESYEYDASKRSYEFQAAVAESGQYSLDYLLKSLTSAFYAGYDYASGSASAAITAKKDTTFLNRPATEYTFSASAGSATATLNIVFDNATGITLKIYGSASGGGDNSSAEYEVTSFAVGDAVAIPTLNKPSGQGGEGQGGEGQGGEGGGGQGGQTTDVFSNKLLMYASNENYNVFNGSQLALFSDKKFELTFYENGYRVVMFGTYTIAASNDSATLVVNKVYKDQGKEMTDMSQTWTLTYASGGYTLQVTQTGKVNYNASAVAPTHADIPSQGGQGGSGETGDESKFVNRKFDCFRDHGATLYTYSSLAIFQDGTFEFSYKENNKLVVYLGEYNIDTTDTVATLSVKKIYKEQTNSYSQVSNNLTWTFTSVQDYFVLMMSASVSLDYEVSNGQPVHADIPDDPNGQAGQDDQRFLVSNTVWASTIEEADVVKMDSNFSARVTTSDNTVGGASYAFDNGKVKYTYKDAYGGQEQYKEYHAEGGFDAYNQDNYGAWVKTSYSAAYGTIASYNESLGIIRVPYDKVTYSSDSHEYVCRSWADSYGTSYENIHIGFDNGKLAKIYYTKWSIRFETEFMLYGTTSVTLPQEGGGNHPTQEQLNDLVRNRVYVYDSAIDNDQKYTAAQLNGFFAGNKISFFTDNSFELTYARLVDLSTGAIQESSMTYIGTYQVQEDSRLVGYNRIVLSIDKVVVDGYLVEDEVDDTMSARIKPNENQVTIWEYDSNADIATYYALNSSATPVHIEYSSEPPVIESKWPAEDIAAKLGQLDLNVTIPNPTSFESIEEENLVSVTDTIPMDYSGVSIVITLDDATNARIVASNYIRGISGFTMDTNDSDFENNKFVLYNTAKDTVITINFSENSPVVSLFVAKYKKPSNGYEEAVRAMQQVIGADHVIPNLLVDDATYSTSNYGTLFVRIAFPEGTDMEEALASVIGNISEQGFHYSPRFLGYVLAEDSDLYSTVVTPTIYSKTELSVKVAREDTSLSGYGITTLSESDDGNPPYINWFYSSENEEESGYEYRAHYSNDENPDQITLHEGDYFFVYDFGNEQNFYASIDERSMNGEIESYFEYDEEIGGFLVLQDFTAYFYLHIEMDNDMIYIKDVKAPISQWEEAYKAALDYNSDYVIPELTIDGATAYVWNGANESIDVTLAEDVSMADVIDALNAKLYGAGFHYSVRYGAFIKLDANATIGFSINEDNTISIYPGTADFADDDGGYGLIILTYDEAGDYYYNDGELIGEINPSNENEYIVRYYFEEGTHFVVYDFSNETQFDVKINEASFGGNYEDYIEYDMDSNSFVVKQSFEADVYIQLSWGNDTIYIELVVNS